MKKTFNQTKPGFGTWIKNHILVIILPGLLLAFNRFWYLFARLITHVTFKDGGGFFEWAIPIDHQIPFVGFFVLPYIASFAYWLVIPFVIYGVMGKQVFYRFVAVTFLAELLGFLWLVILPSKMSYADYLDRSNYANEPFYGLMDKLVYANDLPDNLAPSFHTLSTLLPFVACFGVNQKNKHNVWMISGTGIAFFLVALSTLFVRQHYVVDIFSAVLLVALAYWVVQKAKWERFFARVNEWWNAKICSFIPSWTTLKTNTKHKISYNSNHTRITLMIIFILCSTLLCGGMLYFGAISCVTGDPFQGLWKFGLDGLWPK